MTPERDEEWPMSLGESEAWAAVADTAGGATDEEKIAHWAARLPDPEAAIGRAQARAVEIVAAEAASGRLARLAAALEQHHHLEGHTLDELLNPKGS